LLSRPPPLTYPSTAFLSKAPSALASVMEALQVRRCRPRRHTLKRPGLSPEDHRLCLIKRLRPSYRAYHFSTCGRRPWPQGMWHSGLFRDVFHEPLFHLPRALDLRLPLSAAGKPLSSHFPDASCSMLATS
jgi:hypothetical protein